MQPDHLRYLRAASHVFGTPLLLTESQSLLIGEYLAARVLGRDIPEPQGNRFQGEEVFQNEGLGPEWQGYARIGSAARISLMGELVNRGAWMGSYSGMTAYEGFSEQLSRAVADPEVATILLDVNTPGGAAHGMTETARRIKAAAAEKPVVAVVNSLAASAGYGLVSGASEIVMSESSEVGSIGVVLVHYDRSEQLANAGVKVTMIHAGKSKVDGHPYGPLEGRALDNLQSRVDRIMTDFVGLVSEHRTMDQAAIRDLEASLLSSGEAIDAGLADQVATFDDVVSDLSRARVGRSTSQTRGLSMSETTTAPDATASGITQAQLDSAVAAARSEGRTEGIVSERDRIGAILGSEEAKGREAQAQHFAFKTEMSPEDARAALATASSASSDPEPQSFEDRKDAADDIDLGGPAKSEKPASGLRAAVDRQISRLN
jgi:signal peptide peptidase SppA